MHREHPTACPATSRVMSKVDGPPGVAWGDVRQVALGHGARAAERDHRLCRPYLPRGDAVAAFVDDAAAVGAGVGQVVGLTGGLARCVAYQDLADPKGSQLAHGLVGDRDLGGGAVGGDRDVRGGHDVACPGVRRVGGRRLRRRVLGDLALRSHQDTRVQVGAGSVHLPGAGGVGVTWVAAGPAAGELQPRGLRAREVDDFRDRGTRRRPGRSSW